MGRHLKNDYTDKICGCWHVQNRYVLVQYDPFEVRIDHLKGQNHSRTISCGCFSKSSGEIKIQRFLEQ